MIALQRGLASESWSRFTSSGTASLAAGPNRVTARTASSRSLGSPRSRSRIHCARVLPPTSVTGGDVVIVEGVVMGSAPATPTDAAASARTKPRTRRLSPNSRSCYTSRLRTFPDPTLPEGAWKGQRGIGGKSRLAAS